MPDPVGQPLDGLGEGQVVDLLLERDDVAALAAAEAVEEPAGRRHLEARGLLVVEGAQALQRPAAGVAQGDVRADDLVDPGPVADGDDVLVVDPPGHARSLVPHHLRRSRRAQAPAARDAASVNLRDAILSPMGSPRTGLADRRDRRRAVRRAERRRPGQPDQRRCSAWSESLAFALVLWWSVLRPPRPAPGVRCRLRGALRTYLLCVVGEVVAIPLGRPGADRVRSDGPDLVMRLGRPGRRRALPALRDRRSASRCSPRWPGRSSRWGCVGGLLAATVAPLAAPLAGGGRAGFVLLAFAAAGGLRPA